MSTSSNFYVIPVIGLLMATTAFRLSYWQWGRHIEKQQLIAELDARVEMPPTSLNTLAQKDQVEWDKYIHRRATISGQFLYADEIVLRNRRHEGVPGVYVLTPILLDESERCVLVNRGFLPLKYAKASKRQAFFRPTEVRFLGLLKESVSRRFLAPHDALPGSDGSRIDSWLRPDIENIQKQLSCRALPIYVEIISATTTEKISSEIVRADAGREELVTLMPRSLPATDQEFQESDLPVPVFSAIVPPGRHFGYIFEWAFLGLLALAGSFIYWRKRRLAGRDAGSL